MGLFLVSGSKSLANYLHNIKLEVSAESGLILHQNRTKDFSLGMRQSDYNGCSWIAIYNAARILGLEVRPADIIRYLETRLFLGGVALGGRLGAYPWGIGTFFDRLGCRCRYGFCLEEMEKLAHSSNVGILLYIRGSLAGHFVAFKRLGNGLYEFYNVDSGICRDTLPSFLDKKKVLGKVAVFVSKRLY